MGHCTLLRRSDRNTVTNLQNIQPLKLIQMYIMKRSVNINKTKEPARISSKVNITDSCIMSSMRVRKWLVDQYCGI